MTEEKVIKLVSKSDIVTKEVIEELDRVLEKYGITIYEATEMYERVINKRDRLTQCHPFSENRWSYCDSEEKNPCGCGSNCYHYEYDRTSNKIYGVCNVCGSDIFEVKDEYRNELLHKGIWSTK